MYWPESDLLIHLVYCVTNFHISGQILDNILYYCHTRLHLGFSAKLRIQQVLACKMEPRSGIIFCKNRPDRPDPTDQPVQFKDLLFLSMLCGVPTPIVPLINKVCAVSPPNSSHNQESMCGVPPSQYMFVLCGVPPPMQNCAFATIRSVMMLSKNI